MLVCKPARREITIAETWEWEKEPSVFPWLYDVKETCFILSGKAEVTDDSGFIFLT